jgi:molybdopterin-dependent oxidoreductase alpha subunit
MSHEVKKTWSHRLRNAVPFGFGQTKPHHFQDMLKVAWKNRDNLGYAWKVLSRGVCDGCALGVAGFHDWTIKGVHLCMTRLNLLRLNTMPAFDPALLGEISSVRHMTNAELRELGRLGYPMLRTGGERGFRRITWDEAYARIARQIRGTDPKRVAFFLTSRAITNEVYYVAQKVARLLGTNNIDNAARLCHSPSFGAMKHGIGIAATTCSYKDWWGTDLVIFFGSNPANDQPVTTKYLHEAKQLGTKVVLVNPYLEPGMERYWVPSNLKSALFGTNITDFWFPVAQSGDIAFLYGVLKLLIENGWYDRDFVSASTAGFEELKARVATLDFQSLEQQCGLPKSAMQEFAELIHNAKTAVLVWSMGITQHTFGGDAVSMIINLGLVKGFVGRDKCGLMPIRGHSGVQGGAEVGASSTFPGSKPINVDNAAALSKLYKFPVPDWIGLTAPEMVEAGDRGELDLLYCLGGNFLRTLPEPDYVARAMANIPLRVHQDIILTDQMFIEGKGDVILLPAATRYEQQGGGTETITERRIVFSPEIPRQVGEAKAEWQILRELLIATYPERAGLLGCATGQTIREEIAHVVPFYDGIQHLKKTGDAVQYGGPHLCAGGKFPTADGKARFRVVDLPNVSRAPGEFDVSTRRGKQFNTLIYDEFDPLTGAGRDAVFMNPDDAARLHLANHDRVALVNDLGRYEGRVFLAPISPGNLQVHWPEGNVIIRHGLVDSIGGAPDYTAGVRVEKVP